MRRFLGALLTISSVTYLALGCASLESPPDPSPGGGGSDSSSNTGAGSGGGTAGVGAVPRSEVAPIAGFDAPMAGCNPAVDQAPAVSLSVPSARAMASGAQVRGIIGVNGDGSSPQPSLVRADEIFNYNHIDYPAKSTTELTVVTELVRTNMTGDFLLQIGVQAPTAKVHRKPTSITVLVDTSQSMEGAAMLRANAAVVALAASLNKDDVLSLVTTDSEIKPVLRRAQSAGDPALFQKGEIGVSGAGSLANGLVRAYQQASSPDGYLSGGLNRLVVITDGGGLASAIDTKAIAGQWTEKEIRLVGVGVGSARGYKNDLLAAATTAGHGPSLYLDSEEEADRALHQRFDEVMDEAVRDVSISVQLPWIFKKLGAELPVPADTTTPLTRSDLGRGRSMVFRRPVTACGNVDITAYADLPIKVTTSWTEPGIEGDRMMMTSTTLKEASLEKASKQIFKASAVLAFANALQSLDLHRFLYACNRVSDARAAFAAPTSTGTEAGDAELDSILAQLSAHPTMKGQTCQ